MSLGISMKALKKILLIEALDSQKRLGTSNVSPKSADAREDIKDFELASGDATEVKHLRVGHVFPGSAETSIIPYLNETFGNDTVSLSHQINVMTKFRYTDESGKTYYRVRLNTTNPKSIDGDAQGRKFLDKSTTSKWVWTSSLLSVPEEAQVTQDIAHDPHNQYAVKSGETLVLHPTLDPNIGAVVEKDAGDVVSVAKEKRNPSLQGDAKLFCTILIDGVEYHVDGDVFDAVTELVRYGIALAILTDEQTGEQSILPVQLINRYEESGVTMYTCEYEETGENNSIEKKTMVLPESELALPAGNFDADTADKPRGLVMDDTDLNEDGILGDLVIRMKKFVNGNDVYYECLSYNEDNNEEIIAPSYPNDNSNFIPGAYFVKESAMLPAREVISWLSGNDKRAEGIGIGTTFVEQEAAWNESLANGGLKKYYEKYPEEDIWDTVQNQTGGWNNVGCEFISYDMQGQELATGKAVKVWETGNTSDASNPFIKVRVIENSVAEWIDRVFYVAGNAKPGDTLYELFTDKELTQSANVKVKLTNIVLVNGVHNILGAIYAGGAQYPWIILNFDEDVNARVKFTYINPADGQEHVVFPWGDTVFGRNKNFGCASLPSEFPGIITATAYRQDVKDGSIVTASNFEPANLTIELVRE